MKKDETIEAEIVDENQIVLRAIKYPVSTTDLDNLLEEYKEIPNINPDDNEEIVAEQFNFVLTGHKKFVKARNQIEKTRKELKAPALDYGKSVDGIAKEFQLKIKATEDKLHFQRKIVEDNEARKQREAEEAEELRVDNIKKLISDIRSLAGVHYNSNSEQLTKALEALTVPSEEMYQEFLPEAREAQQISIMQLQEMRKSKVLAENAEKFEAEREEEAKKLKAEQDAKLQIEREEFEEKQREFAEKQAAFERQQREQQEVIDRQKAEIEADELAKRQELERQQREQQDKDKFGNAVDLLLKELKELKTISKIANAIIDGNVTNVSWRF